MSITARQIDRGRYIIGDQGYGFILCRVDFALELCNELSEERLQKIADDIRDVMVKKLEMENGGKDET